ncbi:MAG: LPS export ABC transporter permease LptG [Rhizobiaceae bacterium]|nr:LPS export ABC transporter permease LptG [Rhizobiaceae bacterium]
MSAYSAKFGTLQRYIGRKYMLAFGINFLVLIALIFLVDFSENARRFSAVPGYSAGIMAYLTILKIPELIQITIPFVILIASMSTLMGLNRKYELVIARASGLSAWQFLTPLLFCNLIIGILSVGVLNPLGAYTAKLGTQIAAEVGFGSGLRSVGNNAPWLRQITDEGSAIIGGRSSTENGKVLIQVTILRFNDDNTVRDRVDADKATLTDGFWVLDNARITTSNQPIVSQEQLLIKTNLQAEFIEETFASADSVSFFELPSKIKAANSFGLKANAYVTKLHQLIALPALLVAMTLLAAMVSLTFVRFGQSLYSILGGILCGFLLYVVSELITAFGETGSVPPIVAAWVPVIVASTIGTTVLLHKEDG